MSISQEDVKEGRINDELGTQLESLSAQVEANLEQGRNRWAEWKASASDGTRQAINAANDFAREKPWQLVLGASAVGLVLGLLLAPRRRSSRLLRS
jgi:ElaB/YqjD/DUF883 family membrane-anchored ribosome-binding protein